MRYRRPKHVLIRVHGADVQLRDQAPLHAANVAFADGWQLEDLVEALNRRVFFWPGTSRGPNDYGVRHFARYQSEGPVILRTSTAALLRQNQESTPLFCRFNSGSPRYSGGRASPRGADIFVVADRFCGGLSDVVELTFPNEVRLPIDTEWSCSPSGPWRSLHDERLG